MSEIYPLTLFRTGDAFVWDGRPTDMLIVADAAAHDAALDDGWRESADYLAGESVASAEDVDTQNFNPPADAPILNKNAPEIIATLPHLTLAQLNALLRAETAGKTRKGVLAAIQDAIASA